MKKAILLFLVLAAIPFALAQNLTYTESLTLENNIFSSYEVLPQAPEYTLEYIQINLSFFPKKTSTQDVLEITAFPNAKISADSILFNISNPERNGSYEVNSKIKTEKNFPKITRKINFPVDDVPADAEEYTNPSDYIDSDNPEIIHLASELAEGEDDLFVVVSKLADWTKQNIKYDLSTLTEDVSQKASWVLENKEGVCDELTNLFIALSRALGIPARFASGLSYTEMIENKWGPHGWAEVYFPGYGWIPFDVTYGEFGFTDPTHILYKITTDTKDITTSYGWYGKDVKVDFEDLNFGVNSLAEEKSQPAYSIEVKTIYEKINFNSYNLITATITNPNNYYIAPNLRLEKVKEIENIDKNDKTAILAPKSSKNIFWIVKTQVLEKEYEYTFPVIITGSDGTTAKTEFLSSVRYKAVDRNEIASIASALEESEEKVYTKNFVINCSSEKQEYFMDEDIAISCEFHNKGNMVLNDLEACLENDCKYFNLGISQKKSYNFNVKAANIGKQMIPVFAKNQEISATGFAEFNVLDYPKIEVGKVNAPANISYRENATISFVIFKKSVSVPINVTIKIKSETISREYSIESLSEDKQFEFTIFGKELDEGLNKFAIEIIYNDLKDNEYLEKSSFEINLSKLSAIQKISLFFKKLLGFMR